MENINAIYLKYNKFNVYLTFNISFIKSMYIKCNGETSP